MSIATLSACRLPTGAGIGFKPQHFAEILQSDLQVEPPIRFVEIHAENYMGAGGAPHAQLRALRERFALSVHGVGLSIGSPQPLDRAHLARLKALCDRYKPQAVSEHLAWSSHGGIYFNDLLPLPYTKETLARVVEHVDLVQSTLGRELLLENPSTYVAFAESTIPEVRFLTEVSRRSGCRLLLDINNVFVSATNHGTDPASYLACFPLDRVGEIHLGGHDAQSDDAGAPLLIDAHGAPVADPVWALYADVISRAGARPTLIEWDNDVPAWPVLVAEARRANSLLKRAARTQAALASEILASEAA